VVLEAFIDPGTVPLRVPLSAEIPLGWAGEHQFEHHIVRKYDVWRIGNDCVLFSSLSCLVYRLKVTGLFPAG
jgi:hypothetical protein